MFLRWGFRSSFACALTLVASGAVAQDSSQFQVDRFEPMPSQGINVLNVATSPTLGHGQGHLGLFTHFVSGTLKYRDGGRELSLVDTQLKAEIFGAIGILGWIDLGVVMPLVAYQSGDDLAAVGMPGMTLDTTALGDVRVVPKFKLLDPAETGGLGFAVLPLLSLPTGSDLNSDGGSRFEPRVVLDYHRGDFALSLNGGYAFRDKRRAENIVIDDVWRYAAGVRVPVGMPGVSALATFTADVQTEKDRDPANLALESEETSTSPMEADFGVQYVRDEVWVFQVGGGLGLNDDVGAPGARVFLSAAYTPLKADADRDGILDADDLCRNEAEDLDGFEDLDGCPDLDNDLDGLADAQDACPGEPEDLDGFEDGDGCPELDNDGDGIQDAADACPVEAGVAEKKGCPLYDKDADGVLDEADACVDVAEDMDGFQDEDGCPEADNDGDGVLDADDKCPNAAEDMDGFEDTDGCPELDNDRDGVLDAEDKCPNEAEVINGVDDLDGCPDKGKSKVRITTTKIEILDKVFFDTNKASIKPRSYNLLNQVAQILKANPQITKLRVEGHTDTTGNEASNQTLSQERAASVLEYLKAQGVTEDRLVAQGFGQSKPLADNKTAAGRDQNRRVEFVIAEVDGKAVEGDGPVLIEKKEVVEEAPAPEAQP